MGKYSELWGTDNWKASYYFCWWSHNDGYHSSYHYPIFGKGICNHFHLPWLCCRFQRSVPSHIPLLNIILTAINPKIEKYKPGIQGPKTLQGVRIVTDADTYAEHESAEGIVTKFTVGEVVWDKMVNSTKSADNEKRDNNQTTFHAFVSFPLLYNRYHKPLAHKVLPMTAATVMTTASSPRVCNPLMIDSLPPTSIPRRKRRIHIRRVIILCIHDSRLR